MWMEKSLASVIDYNKVSPFLTKAMHRSAKFQTPPNAVDLL